MKQVSNTAKQRTFVELDKRELVNIDLYHNEMKVIDGQLNAITEKHPQSKLIHEKIEYLKKALRRQKINLERLRKNCQPEYITKEIGRKKPDFPNKSFFEILNDFENQFGTVRQQAGELVNRWQ
jgi:hypothetical protein